MNSKKRTLTGTKIKVLSEQFNFNDRICMIIRLSIAPRFANKDPQTGPPGAAPRGAYGGHPAAAGAYGGHPGAVGPMRGGGGARGGFGAR